MVLIVADGLDSICTVLGRKLGPGGTDLYDGERLANNYPPTQVQGRALTFLLHHRSASAANAPVLVDLVLGSGTRAVHCADVRTPNLQSLTRLGPDLDDRRTVPPHQLRAWAC